MANPLTPDVLALMEQHRYESKNKDNELWVRNYNARQLELLMLEHAKEILRRLREE